MSRSTRHKRLRKVELQKLKLKSGRKLKKAQNETKTEFKARKIILKEQLAQKDPNAVATKKKLNLKDLTCRLKHHSVYVRQDGLDGIREIIGDNTKEVLTPEIASIIQSVVPSIQDVDVLVRKTAVKIIDMLLTKVGTLMNPYLAILSSNLCCAMVHLDSGVQTDSLHLMEALIKHVPTVIARNADTLLDNFLFLIARRIKSDPENVSQYSETCHLISNPNSVHATMKWRIQLLKSLSGYLEAVITDRTKGGRGKQENYSIRDSIVIGCLPSLLNKSNAVTNSTDTNTKVLANEKKTREFVTSLVKILFEVWAEVDTGSEYSVQGNPLHSLAVQVLLCISQIILHLFKLIELVLREDSDTCTWFTQGLRQKFNSDILPGFPYSPHKTFLDYGLDGPASNDQSSRAVVINQGRTMVSRGRVPSKNGIGGVKEGNQHGYITGDDKQTKMDTQKLGGDSNEFKINKKSNIKSEQLTKNIRRVRFKGEDVDNKNEDIPEDEGFKDMDNKLSDEDESMGNKDEEVKEKESIDRNLNSKGRRKLLDDRSTNACCQRMNINLASIAMLLDTGNEALRCRVADYYADVLQHENTAHIPDIVNTCCRLLPYCDLLLAERLLQTSVDAFRSSSRHKRSLTQIPLKATDWDCQLLWNSPKLKLWIEALIEESASNIDNEYIYIVLVHFKLRNVANFQRILRESGHFNELLKN